MATELPNGVGYIGLGNMGIGMAGNLLSYVQSPEVWGGPVPFHVYNRTASKAAPLVARGAIAAGSPAQLASTCHVVFSCLENDDALRSVAGALFAAAPRGLVFVDSSTVLPATTRQLARDAAEVGVVYVAAPVFGRPPAAAAKQVLFVIAGSPEGKAKVTPYLQAIGRGVLDVGEEPHLANVTKLSGNFYITSLVEMISEGFALAEKNGVPRQKMAGVLNALCPTPIITGYSTRIAEGGFEMREEEPGFSVLGGMKDVGHILELGRESGVPLPMSEIVMKRLEEYKESGKGRETNFEGFSSMVFKSAGLE